MRQEQQGSQLPALASGLISRGDSPFLVFSERVGLQCPFVSFGVELDDGNDEQRETEGKVCHEDSAIKYLIIHSHAQVIPRIQVVLNLSILLLPVFSCKINTDGQYHSLLRMIIDPFPLSSSS